MTIERAVKLLKETYTDALRLEYVNDPVAFALYQVWKIADMER